MRLSVEKITDIGIVDSVRLTAEELNCQLDAAAHGSVQPFVGEIMVDYRLSRLERRLLLNGRVKAELALTCGRCLKNFGEQMQESFSLALNLVDTADTSAVEELELNEELINNVPLVAGEVNLLPILYEQLLMRLPAHPVCRDDCAGLCPYCGADQNENSCHCEPKPFNNRFGKLKNLKLDGSK